MGKISDPPIVYDFGEDYNYSQWNSDTRITLCNVPWNNDYRDIVKFENKAALNAFIDNADNAPTTIESASYAPVSRPIRIDIPFNVAYRFNYLRTSNPKLPDDRDVQRDYYYFILDVNYIAPNTTEIIVQLDIWTTFCFDVDFGNVYIDRGHIGIAHQHSFDNYGRDYLTIPEGLDIGGEYQIITHKSEKVIDTDATRDDEFEILVASIVDLSADPGGIDANGVDHPPILKTAPGGLFQGLPSGASYYLFRTVNNFRGFMTQWSNKPWVTQGIISVTVIPKITRYIPDFNYVNVSPRPDQHPFYDVPSQLIPTVQHSMFNDWRNSNEILNAIPERYRQLRKFLTYPYTVIEMTTWTGTPIIIKPESWANDDADIVEQVSLIPPNQRVGFYPQRYNAKKNSPIGSHANGGPGDDGGEFVDMLTQIANFPTMAIVNDQAIAYMASNRNSLAYQHSAADWAQARALTGNQLAYDQSSQGIETASAMQSNEVANALAQASNTTAAMGAHAALGAAQGTIMGAAALNPVAAANGLLGGTLNGIGTAIDVASVNQSTANQIGLSGNQLAAQNSQSRYMRDTNKAYSDYAAKGDYAQANAAINAKVQDVRLTQPSTSGQVGGESMNLVNDQMEVNLRWKMIDPSAMAVVGEYWLRYGYPVRRFAKMPSSLQVMSKFTYWGLTETYIRSASMPEAFKQVIRGIFEKGVTVWKNPNDIGNIDAADNVPLEGVTLSV